MLAVVYGKAVDDKELGIYIEGVFFGGVAQNQTEADQLARTCVNGTHGGTAIPKIMPVRGDNLHQVFSDAISRFNKVEREMIETENTLSASQWWHKCRR